MTLLHCQRLFYAILKIKSGLVSGWAGRFKTQGSHSYTTVGKALKAAVLLPLLFLTLNISRSHNMCHIDTDLSEPLYTQHLKVTPHILTGFKMSLTKAEQNKTSRCRVLEQCCITEYQPQNASATVFPPVLFGFWQGVPITDWCRCFHQILQAKDGTVLITAVHIIKSSISLMA